MRNRTPVVFLAGALALSIGNAAAVPYTFTNIADSSGPFDLLEFAPSLNNSGTVAFAAFLDTGDLGIFIGDGGPTTTLYDTSGPFSSVYEPSLNDSGTVAFQALLDTGVQGIFTGSGGPTTTIADSSGSFVNFGDGTPSLNDSGTVAFFANLNTSEQGVFTGRGGPTTTIADSSGPFFHVTFPSLNDSGTVAFFGSSDDTGSLGGVFTGSGGPITTIADSSGPFSAFSFLTLNDSGTVAFLAFLDTGEPGPGIFIGSGGPTVTIADSSGPFSRIASYPSLNDNDSGTVAFFADLDTGERGIFTGPDPLVDEVIGTGDTLFGSTVLSLLMYRESLNEAGQIAFTYRLADGRTGVARADPQVTPVPEPGILILLVAGLLGAVLWRKGKLT